MFHLMRTTRILQRVSFRTACKRYVRRRRRGYSSEAISLKRDDDLELTPGYGQAGLLEEVSELSRTRCSKLKPVYEEYYVIALIDAFIRQQQVDLAAVLFNGYRREGHQFDVNVYNKLLFGWAAINHQWQAENLYNGLNSDGVEPDAQTFAGMLWLYSKTNNTKYIKKILKHMDKKWYKVEHLFYQACLTSEQVESINRGLTEVLGKDFLPVRPPQAHQLSYPLLVRDLYGEQVEKFDTDGINDETYFSEKRLGELLDKQLQIEKQGGVYIRNISPIDVSTGDSDVTENIANTALSELRSKWNDVLVEKIESEMKKYQQQINKLTSNRTQFNNVILLRNVPKYMPFLSLLKAMDWATIVLDQLVPVMQQPDGIRVHYLCHLIIQLAWERFVVDQKEKAGITNKISLMYLDYAKFLNSPEASRITSREFWTNCASSHVLDGSLSTDVPVWPKSVAYHVSGALLHFVVNLFTLSQSDEPAFHHTYESEGARRIGVIKAHTDLVKLVKKSSKDKEVMIKMDTQSLPMFVPPRPWVATNDGSYLATPAHVMRVNKDVYQHQLLLDRTKNLYPVLDALNYLGSTPWKINKRILDLQLELFNSSDNNEDLEIPYLNQEPLPVIPKDVTVKERAKVTAKRKSLIKKQRESYALRMEKLYKLSLASFLQDETFWLPHDIDFRGRAYAIPPHISHLSSDSNRALMLFATGKPLGENGLDWLKIHLVNLHGAKKKLPLQGRLDYANEMMSEVFDSAEKPLTGNRWWQGSDEPWQVLACSMEIVDAIRSGDPAGFVSNLPVHQDGSCNGLQHYAALGQDQLGAEQVNLTPMERPADLYTTVANMVDKRRAAHAAEAKKEALILEGKIHRKVVKQTVMTIVYGVTWVGGREQIARQLKGTIPDEDVFPCSNYLVGLVFDSLAEAFKNAREIQNWLTDSARQISKAGKPVQWTTPLGLPVIQPYHMSSEKQIHTLLQSIVRSSSSEITNPPNVREQKMAMPPNFVHSLDSTHMMLTALHCQRKGVTFVAVHDCFWTHACSVDEMNKLCREQFVALHHSPILNNLAKEFEEKFGHLTYEEQSVKKSPTGGKGIVQCSFKSGLPGRGNFDIKEVLKSVYFFS